MAVRVGQWVAVRTELGAALGEVVAVVPGAVVVEVEGAVSRVPSPQVRTLTGQPIIRRLTTQDFSVR